MTETILWLLQAIAVMSLTILLAVLVGLLAHLIRAMLR